jgi:predicted phosphate transport protein (TIGR00153 family)
MRLRLTPRETGFFDMFAGAAGNLVEGARLLTALLRDGADADEVAAALRDCEHAGDDATHAIVRRVNGTFVTPFAREDIVRLASDIDDVLDHMEAAAKLVRLYGLRALPAHAAALADVLERAARATAGAMPALAELDSLDDYWIGIHRLENEADEIYHRLLAHLFGGGYDTLTVLKLKEVADELEGAADAFENVANTVETIAVKEA